MRKSLPIALLFACCASLNAVTTTVDFNTAGDLASKFTIDTTGGGLFESAGTGLSGSRAVRPGGDFFGAQSVSVQSAGAVSFSTLSDFSVTQSMYFQTRSGNTGTGQDPVILGLTTSSSLTKGAAYQLIGGGERIAVATRVINANDTGSVISAEFQGSDSFNGGFFGGFGSPFSLSQADQWYFYETTFAYDSANDEWDITWRISESDANGVVGSEVATLTRTRANTLTITASDTLELYGFFASENGQTANVLTLDNVTLVGVPEPSAFALIAGSLAFAGIMVRRRR